MSLNSQQFGQIPMFMSAREIKDQATPGDWMGGDPRVDQKHWGLKLKQSKQSGLYDSIRDHGVQTPVDLYLGGPADMMEQWSGHHRVASAYDADPDRLMPVWHHDPHNSKRPM